MKIHYVLKGSNGETHTGTPKKGHNNKKHPLGVDVLIQGFSLKVVEMCTGPKREAPDVVHLAQQ